MLYAPGRVFIQIDPFHAASKKTTSKNKASLYLDDDDYAGVDYAVLLRKVVVVGDVEVDERTYYQQTSEAEGAVAAAAGICDDFLHVRSDDVDGTYDSSVVVVAVGHVSQQHSAEIGRAHV